jgi:ADP-ribose pyrophosphatase YjhB (NUDIX family)
MSEHRNPVPTVDIIIDLETPCRRKGIVLISRKNPPRGWALPGGFVDYGESLEAAAVREALEETSLEVTLLRQFHTYSDPSRDTRMHAITTVYIATAGGTPAASDDAKEIKIVTSDSLPEQIVFDHRRIIEDYFNGAY